MNRRTPRPRRNVVVQVVCRHPTRRDSPGTIVSQYVVTVVGRNVFSGLATMGQAHLVDSNDERVDETEFEANAARDDLSAHHQLRCETCRHTERISQVELTQLIQKVALADAPGGNNVDLASIRRILKLLD